MRTPRMRPVWRSWCILALVTASLGVCAPPTALAQEPARAASPPLARYFPRQDLVAYLEFDGLDNHRRAWNKTAAARLLDQTTTGAMYRAALPRLFDALLGQQSEVELTGPEMTDLVLHLLRNGFAVGINRSGGSGAPRSFAIVVRGGAKGQIRELLERLLQSRAPSRRAMRELHKPGGRTLHQFATQAAEARAWWSEGDDFVISLARVAGADAVIDALDGRIPNAASHPTRQSLVESADAPGFEPVGIAFFDMAALPGLPPLAGPLGLDRIKRFDYRWGLSGDALLSILGAAVPAPRTGIPAFFDQPRLDPGRLPPLPAALAGFTLLSLDGSRLAPLLANSLEAITSPPDGNKPTVGNPGAALLRETIGVSLYDDVFAHLGTEFVFYDVATRINAPSHVLDSLALGFLRAPKMALVGQVKNRDALSRALEKLVDVANQNLLSISAAAGGNTLASIERLKNGEVGYVLSFAGSPAPISPGLRPTLLLGKQTLVLASTPSLARRARDLAESGKRDGAPTGAPLGARLDWLPPGLTMLSVSDTANSVYPELIAALPGFTESAIRGQRFIPWPLILQELAPSPFDFASPALSPSRAVPRTAAAPLPWDAELVPDPDDLRPFLFPSVTALAVDDAGIRFISREAIPTLNPASAVPIALAALVPAIRSAERSIELARSTAGLKKIGEAFQRFHEQHNRFPADVRHKNGTPLLSWRVAILPFLGEEELFKQFHQDEPWDSPHNKALIPRMPQAFAIPDDPAPEPGHTFYRGFESKGALFDRNRAAGFSLADISDGTAGTIAVVEAKEAVPWTRPGGGLTIPESASAEKIKSVIDTLGGHTRGGFSALFCDGSVRFIKSTVSHFSFLALTTVASGDESGDGSF